MALADWERDGNRWLDEEKVKFTNSVDATDEASSADALVRASLSDVYDSALVASWEQDGTGSAATPALVRYVAGRLMAAYRYAKKYSQQDRKTGDYAIWLEEGALAILTSLKDGSIVLPEVGVTSPLDFSQVDFWPNDSTGVLDPESDIKFATNMVF